MIGEVTEVLVRGLPNKNFAGFNIIVGARPVKIVKINVYGNSIPQLKVLGHDIRAKLLLFWP